VMWDARVARRHASQCFTAARADLAAQGYAVATRWQCEKRSISMAMQFFSGLMPSSRGTISRRGRPAPVA
jgi:hypothetical protein